ncbi:PREDICTED: regulator of nonsense transcripts 2-like [Amphimedon queenslandica]|uniref:Up-frameshift suppressor 2 C-terminal domain-containing protein n=1 Tax=Amphimedon queenslandica TaxID=400682 RepID=A0A1X7VR34_AMPQE|nr:PREDICTED: regulator of nonsense transcripts 2-like [Amphimedon queenslandica]|eukprot:XP_019854933.1 PREDICTED: regulator of nonsense transcripts 2-like [Amphimedon queenslandica]
MITETCRADVPKVPVVDIAIPITLRKPIEKPATTSTVEDKGQMKFTVLMKKGNKPQLKELNVPADNILASGLKETQLALENEKKEMKKIVLTHERRQTEELRQEEEAQDFYQVNSSRQIPLRQPPQHHPAWNPQHHHGNHFKPHPHKKPPGWNSRK